MQPVIHMIAMFSALAASSLIAATWQGAVLAMCVAVCLHLFPEVTAAIRSFVWMAVFLLILVLHFAASSIRSSPGFQSQHIRALHLNFGWSVAIASAWILLSIIRGSQLVRSAVRLHGIARKAIPVEGSVACTTILRSAPRPVNLCTSTDVESPSVIGFISPRILIPVALFEKLSAAELEQVVLHEMEHLRRGDDWINLLQKVSLVLFSLNPVLPWVERRLCMERELACDDGVLRYTKAPKAYARCLTNLAEHSMLHRGTSLALRAWERRSELAKRVRRILQRSDLEIAAGPAKVLASVLMLGLIGGAAGLSYCPSLVSFSPSSVPAVNTAAGPQLLTPSNFRDAVFHPGAAHPIAVDAVMSERVPAKVAVTKRPHRRRSQIRHKHGRNAVMSAWLLVTYSNHNPSISHLQFTVINLQTSFPAGPRSIGWTVFQL